MVEVLTMGKSMGYDQVGNAHSRTCAGQEVHPSALVRGAAPMLRPHVAQCWDRMSGVYTSLLNNLAQIFFDSIGPDIDYIKQSLSRSFFAAALF